MTDRVPGAPGQYRAVITAEEQQKLAASEAFIITLTRDDQPLKEGTPYSKAAVLPDEVAQVLCPSVEDPTPADAFAALAARAVESQDHPGCYYRMADGEQEWLNPPMELGVDYRTTQRYCGKPVYVRTLNLGALPAGSASNTGYKWTNIGLDVSQVLDWKATLRKKISSSGGKVPVLYGIPYVSAESTKVSANLYFNEQSVVLTSTVSLSDVEDVNLWIRYIKEAV